MNRIVWYVIFLLAEISAEVFGRSDAPGSFLAEREQRIDPIAPEVQHAASRRRLYFPPRNIRFQSTRRTWISSHSNTYLKNVDSLYNREKSQSFQQQELKPTPSLPKASSDKEITNGNAPKEYGHVVDVVPGHSRMQLRVVPDQHGHRLYMEPVAIGHRIRIIPEKLFEESSLDDFNTDHKSKASSGVQSATEKMYSENYKSQKYSDTSKLPDNELSQAYSKQNEFTGTKENRPANKSSDYESSTKATGKYTTTRYHWNNRRKTTIKKASSFYEKDKLKSTAFTPATSKLPQYENAVNESKPFPGIRSTTVELDTEDYGNQKYFNNTQKSHSYDNLSEVSTAEYVTKKPKYKKKQTSNKRTTTSRPAYLTEEYKTKKYSDGTRSHATLTSTLEYDKNKKTSSMQNTPMNTRSSVKPTVTTTARYVDEEGNIIEETTTENRNILSEGSGDFSSLNFDFPENFNFSGRFFNLLAADDDKCTTPKNEPGHCKNIRQCVLHDVVNNFSAYFQYMCRTSSTLLGVCCPDNPVIEVTNPDKVEVTTSVARDLTQPLDGCGMNSRTRIVGGTIAKPHEWTWMVALLRQNRFFCGGVLINNWYVLTAAHCVMSTNIRDVVARLGEHDLNEKMNHQQDIPLAEVKRHAKFTTLTFQNDIALLKLSRPAKFSRFVGTICLPQTGNNYTNASATVVGWGTLTFGGSASQLLRQVTIPVWDNEVCDRTYALETINESFMCAGSPNKEQDACQGDSGGPLMVLNDQGRWEVIGLVSWGRRCGDPNFPGVYTRVTTYLDWLHENMK